MKIDFKKIKEKLNIHREIDTKGLNFKIWTSFILFAVFILLILWLLQIVFLNTYYESMMKNQVIRTADEIIESYGTGHFQDTIDEYAYNNSMNITILNNYGTVLYSSNISSIKPIREVLMEYDEFVYLVNASKNKEIIYKTDNSRFNATMLIYGKYWDNNYYIYITTPLEPLESTTKILGNQFIYVTIIVLLVGFIISLFISKKLSKPIIKITKTANELAKGNYDVVFENGNYTEVDNLVTTLNYATRELSVTDNLRRELISNVSHDLRTPLTMIKSYAEMVRDISFDDKKKSKKHLSVIIEETDRLSYLVNDIMNLSKLESNSDKLNISTFNLSELVTSIMNRFSYLMEKDKYIIKLNITKKLFIIGDKEKIEQVIYNLIGNAINYTGEDKKVIVNLKEVNDKIIFEVIDSGVGISKNDLGHIWDRYYKVDKEHKRNVIGTGLGLSIVKNILIMHEANYGVISSPNKGSKFYFEFNKKDMK